eukprot:Em0022g975a
MDGTKEDTERTRSGQVHVEAQPSPNKTLYLLSFLNYPDSATNSSVDQGSRYAIDLINSESIIAGYKLNLIEASDDCDISVGTASLTCFGINTPKFLSVAAFAALIDHNGWSRIGILYDPSVLEYVDSYRTFLNAMKNYTVEFAFTSYVSRTYFPLAGLKATYVRVSCPFSDESFKRRSNGVGSKSQRVCCNRQVPTTRYNNICSGINNYDPFENCTDDIGECVLTFDATLALALALNRSIRPLMERNLSLSDYTSGEHSIASIIQQEIMNLSFAGMAGTIVQFDPNTGYPSAVITSLLQYSEEFGYSSTFATMLNGTLHFKDGALCVSSSSNLNHFAYVGCYFILFAEVVYTSGELASFNIGAKTVLCNVFPWCLILGLTLVLSTVCVKTCRLYFIFTASIKGRQVVTLKDHSLASIIVGLLLASAILLTAWTWSHPLVRQATNHTISSGETFVILLEDYCDTENQGVLVCGCNYFEATLLASCVVLAFLNRNVIMKDFQTHSVILLAYLLTLTGIVGAATYFITSSIGALNISLSYGIQCLVLSLTVYLCIFLLFLPPVWPVLKRISALKSGVKQKNPPKRIMRQNTVMSQI